MIYIATNKDNKDALMHYGVKGMKWGKRRQQKWDGSDYPTDPDSPLTDEQQRSIWLKARLTSKNYPKANIFNIYRLAKRAISDGVKIGESEIPVRRNTTSTSKKESNNLKVANTKKTSNDKGKQAIKRYLRDKNERRKQDEQKQRQRDRYNVASRYRRR